MGGDDDPEAFGKFESLVHLAIIHTEKVFVGKKYFEGRGAIGNDLAELGFGLVDEFGDGHVESVIAGAVSLGFGFPELVTFESVVIAIGTTHFNVGGGATDESGDAGGFVGVLGERGHEREIDVDVGIDEAGENQFASGIDSFGAGGGFEVFADTGDGFVFDVDVGGGTGAYRDDFAIFDEERSHGCLGEGKDSTGRRELERKREETEKERGRKGPTLTKREWGTRQRAERRER